MIERRIDERASEQVSEVRAEARKQLGIAATDEQIERYVSHVLAVRALRACELAIKLRERVAEVETLCGEAESKVAGLSGAARPPSAGMTIDNAIGVLSEVLPKVSFNVSITAWRSVYEDSAMVRRTEYSVWDGQAHYRGRSLRVAVDLAIEAAKGKEQNPDDAVTDTTGDEGNDGA